MKTIELKKLLTALAGLSVCASPAWALDIDPDSDQTDYTSYVREDGTREALTIGTDYAQNGTGPLTPVTVNFYKGDDSGKFEFTTFSLNQTNDVLSTFNCTDVTLDLSSSAKIQGKMTATNTNITTTYMRVASGGSLTMTGGSLTLTGDRSDLNFITDPTYQIVGDVTLEDVKVTSAGSLTASSSRDGTSGTRYIGNIVLSGGSSFKGTELVAKTSGDLPAGSISVLDSATVAVDSLSAANLTVSKDATITVDSYDKLTVSNLTIVMDSLETVDFSDIFQSKLDTDTIKGFSAENISVVNSEGVAYEGVTFDIDESTGKVTGIVIPEPSAFGLLAGAFALALVAARRRRK